MPVGRRIFPEYAVSFSLKASQQLGVRIHALQNSKTLKPSDGAQNAPD